MIRRSVLKLAASAVAAAAGLVALGFSTAASAAELDSLNGRAKPVKVTVPDNPQRIAVIDMAVLDILTNWGLTERIVAMPKTTPVPFLKEVFEKDSIRPIGTLKEVDMEGLMASEPDVIFISGRLAKKYDELSRIAPVVYMTTDRELGSLKSFEKNLMNVAKLFGKEAEAQETVATFEARAAAIREKSQGASALVGLVTASHVNLLGDAARCSLIGQEFGFRNLAVEAGANHGNEASFELLLKRNPDYFFVLDRDSAIARPGAKLAKDILANDLVTRMKAYQENRIVYLTPSAWYLAEGGITATDLMFSDVEKALGIEKNAK